MRGLMMDTPLLISNILTHAARFNGDVEVVSLAVEGGVHRYTYRDLAARAAQLAHALHELGVTDGERIGTLAWNGYRHLELYYAVAGIGAVCHTINPRLFTEQIRYIIEHADDRWLFVDLTFVPLLEALAPALERVRGYVILTDEAHMPATSLPNVRCYETLIAGRPGTIEWPQFDENTASGLCYTSGTTGEPKGALYSHRSTTLHAYGACVAEAERPLKNPRALMPIVPMFHVNAWGFPYAAPMMGARLLLNGPAHDSETLYRFMEDEVATTAGAVPVIWLNMLAYLERTGKNLTKLSSVRVGGSSAPRAMIEAYEARGIQVFHGWGMTETSPTCTTGTLRWEHRTAPDRLEYQLKAGRVVYGTQMRIVDEAGRELPNDGESAGELQVRGPWVISAYYDNEAATAQQFTSDGWFKTGDIATLDRFGHLAIHDRSKDVIKSGGEWISSIDLENAAVSHPDVAEAAAIAIPHPKWAERPLLIVVRRPGGAVERDELLAHLAERVAKWWLPDDVVFVAEIPHTATGKISKKTLRERFAARALS